MFIDLEDDKFIEDNLIKKSDCGGGGGGGCSNKEGGIKKEEEISNTKKIVSTYQFGKNKISACNNKS